MSWRTHPIVIALRNAGRRSGLNRWLAAARSPAAYEDRFGKAMLRELRAGDCVWDVGANVGLYSAVFSEVVGARGKVFAFEPSPVNFERLSSAVGALGNVVSIPAALGDLPGRMAFSQGSDVTGATSRVVPAAGGSGVADMAVEVRRGDDVIASAAAADPDVIKIDTEGFELEVVRGLEDTLRRPRLRAVFIEIHFALLAERGLSTAPSQIERRLIDCGFHCAWPDASHLVGLRAAAATP